MNLDKDSLINIEIHKRLSKKKFLNFNKSEIYLEDENANLNILGVFVVSFDHKKGNVLEWFMPGDVNYSGIEFKALVSGFHHVKSDFIYFRHFQFYGIGCFALRPLGVDEGERGVLMKTVGILSTSYLNLHQYLDFLDLSVRHLLVRPGNYDKLIAFYSDQIIKNDIISVIPNSRNLQNIEQINLHGIFDYDFFIRIFGIKIFALWKLVLLRKRILFLSNPPIGPICQQVICCHRLGCNDISQFAYLQSRPIFNISLSDIDQFNLNFWQKSFVGCSTDQIIQMKKSCYDCLIQNSNIELVGDQNNLVHNAISLSSSDRIKFEKLQNIRMNFDCSSNNWEEFVISFFKSENNRLFSALLNLVESGDLEITSSHIEYIGFHPKDDKYFLLLLLETYGIDLVYHVDSQCC